MAQPPTGTLARQARRTGHQLPSAVRPAPPGNAVPGMPPASGIRRFSMPAVIRHTANFFINFRSLPSVLLARRKPHAGIGASREADVVRQVALGPTPDSVECTQRKFPWADALVPTQTNPLASPGAPPMAKPRPNVRRSRVRPPIHATRQRDDLRGPATDGHRLRHERNATRCNPQGAPPPAIVPGSLPSGGQSVPTGKWRLRRFQRIRQGRSSGHPCPGQVSHWRWRNAGSASAGPCFAQMQVS